VRCLIVDDSADFVGAVRSLLEHHGITIVGVASTGAEALQHYQDLRPDVTLVDIDLGAEASCTGLLSKSTLTVDNIRDLVCGSTRLEKGEHG
jgi:DNA-binding NarL/FixJ family response regulator